MGPVDQETRRLAKVVDHPVRSRIIDLLGQKGPLGWKELSLELGVRTGALYHHLDVLEGLVERDSNKKYSLTKSGRIVYARTAEARSAQTIKLAALDLRREGRDRRLAVSVLAPRQVVAALTLTPLRAGMTLVALIASLASLAGALGISPNLYYLRPDPGLFATLGALSASLSALLVIGFVAAKFVFRAKVQLAPLAAGSAMSYLPVFAFYAFSHFPPVASVLAVSSIAYTLILVIVQAWSAAFLGAAISVASGVRIEMSLLVGMAVLYATMFLMLVQGTNL
jgi:Bacterial regulatory protein, arsR family